MTIIKADIKDSHLLSDLARQTFIESHGNSAKAEDINSYIAEKKELINERNSYHLIFHTNQPAGFSNIILNFPYADSPLENIAKLERIYILKEFYEFKSGQQLLDFNVNLAKENRQHAMWLYVWKENPRAIRFYEKNGFIITGSHDFKISETHSNPNHQMLLKL
jgi:diamine N-acetyltransferase